MSNRIANVIPHMKSYVLGKRTISIHSYDRDKNKFKEANEFEIKLPETFTNIQAIRLVNLDMPPNLFVFSNKYQNTKLSFKLLTGSTGKYTIEIQEGRYTIEQLIKEIRTKMNKAVNAAYDKFVCKHNAVNNTFWIGNTQDNFVLLFNQEEHYSLPSGYIRVFRKDKFWGLPYYLGFDKKEYSSTLSQTTRSFDYENPTDWLTASSYYIDSTNNRQINILGHKIIYMELDKKNKIDELTPYSKKTSTMYGNDYSGKTCSAFAKILFENDKDNCCLDANTEKKISYYSPALRHIDRLRFRFRFHDQLLVDFRNRDFSFSLEFSVLMDSQEAQPFTVPKSLVLS
jgi:hypothetical protein